MTVEKSDLARRQKRLGTTDIYTPLPRMNVNVKFNINNNNNNEI